MTPTETPRKLFSKSSASPCWQTGAVALISNRRFGYWLIYIGAIGSVAGIGWSYLPFLPMLLAAPEHRLLATIAGNIMVIGILAWCHLGQRRCDDARPARY